MDDDKKATIGFSVFPGIGPVRFDLLVQYFESPKIAWKATINQLREAHLSEKLIHEFIEFRSSFDINTYIHALVSKHIGVICKTEPHYPPQLKTISDAPFLLYVKGVKGDNPIDLIHTVAVVGTRKITPYGEQITRSLVTGLVQSGFTIVSGMALGVDAVAHTAALDAGGQTIAVLGCGIDIIAPASNTFLYNRIVSSGHGVILSEMPLSHRPTVGLFPARNRIISGLSKVVVVTEGADDSGALITARNAADQGRDVCAVPGPVTSPYSKGPAKLIKNGAQLVEDVSDILNILGVTQNNLSLNKQKTHRLFTPNEQKIYDCLLSGTMHIDEISRRSHLTISDCASILTVLEMEKIVQDIGEKQYQICNNY